MRQSYFIYIIALILVLSFSAKTTAQSLSHTNCEGLDSLSMSYVFLNGAKISKTSETHIEGEQLASRGMTVFRCVNYTATDAMQHKINGYLERDVKRAAGKELKRKQGRLSFALLQYSKARKRQKSYLIFHRKDAQQCVCVYIEGTISVQQIKEMFYK